MYCTQGSHYKDLKLPGIHDCMHLRDGELNSYEVLLFFFSFCSLWKKPDEIPGCQPLVSALLNADQDSTTLFYVANIPTLHYLSKMCLSFYHSPQLPLFTLVIIITFSDYSQILQSFNSIRLSCFHCGLYLQPQNLFIHFTRRVFVVHTYWIIWHSILFSFRRMPLVGKRK